MEEAEIKRQEMMAAQKEGGKKSSGPAMDARKEMSKTKEQVEEEMKISLRIRIKPLDLDAMDSDELKQKAQKIFDTILQLETDKYDYEQRQLDQDYELKELAERQKLQQRNKAIKKGLDPESFTQKQPKWFGVRPGKKAGDPETPEGEEEAAAEEEAEEEYEEEEEEEEDEEEEE